MSKLPSIQWPIVTASFIERCLNGILFNPLFITHWCDVWLGWYVNNILQYHCPLDSPYHINVKKHNQSSINEMDIWDEIIFNCFTRIENMPYGYNNIPKECFIEIGDKIYPQYNIVSIYNKYYHRMHLYNLYNKKRTRYKTRNIDITFIICSVRDKENCYIEEIINTIKNYKYPSYEIIIFCNKYNYTRQNVICLQEDDFGATWGFNRCYSESQGKIIVELTDHCIPMSNIFDFIHSNHLIRSLKNISN
jgi:hypothetical protein